jgi:hypothetical protein
MSQRHRHVPFPVRPYHASNFLGDKGRPFTIVFGFVFFLSTFLTPNRCQRGVDARLTQATSVR